ncbi:hypothetical protein SGFS_103920 [Streptomyces graminofaciens]|uniref:Uncharacterized protein n=1 Tax=Streptomyces graminofaciens TaxID=68212 RepID=A0ABM7FSE0_9ACTN|nr:hypothetical protein [Streptomyces graminofaciens]BBC39098.1 hypothetical protein SGFS_103920 [Streptomyces graminofaciens]
MAFSNAGTLTFLAAGQQVRWNYSWGSDRGFQQAGADVKTPNAGGQHVADEQGKSRFNDGTAAYFVTIANRGPGGAWHNLQGGGGA